METGVRRPPPFDRRRPVMRWECRYSSCEMLYLVVGSADVRCFFDHSEDKAIRWAFADVLAGAHDAEVRLFFGDAAVEELKAEVRKVVRS
jgi:hypothetical protein